MRIKIDYLNSNILLGLIILIIINIFLFVFGLFTDKSFVISISISVFFAFIAGKILRRTNKFISGFIGEKAIDEELKQLGPNFFIKSDFNTGRGNIDKIVLGTAGVWTLEVKSHKGIITFDNDCLLINNKKPEKDFLKQAYAEAKTLEDLIKSKLNISIRVQPVIVFSDKFARVRLGLKTYKGVYIIQKAWLLKLLTENRNQIIEQDSLQRIESLIV